jgi:hypothetical protein
LTSITIADQNGNASSASISVSGGGTDQFHATAHFGDGSTQDITSTATWTSSSTGVATISSPGGLAKAVAAGTTNIAASSGSISSTASGPFVLTVTQ